MQKDALSLKDRIKEGKFSKYGSHICNISIFLELPKNSDSWAPLQTCWISNSGVRTRNLCFTKPSR